MARQIEPLEWQSTIASNRDCDHQVRCISPGLGSSMQWYQDRGTLESCRARDAHNLPGAVNSYISSESNQSIPKGSEGSVSEVDSANLWRNISLLVFTDSKELCPVETLRQYQKVTAY